MKFNSISLNENACDHSFLCPSLSVRYQIASTSFHTSWIGFETVSPLSLKVVIVVTMWEIAQQSSWCIRSTQGKLKSCPCLPSAIPDLHHHSCNLQHYSSILQCRLCRLFQWAYAEALQPGAYPRDATRTSGMCKPATKPHGLLH